MAWPGGFIVLDAGPTRLPVDPEVSRMTFFVNWAIPFTARRVPLRISAHANDE